MHQIVIPSDLPLTNVYQKSCKIAKKGQSMGLESYQALSTPKAPRTPQLAPLSTLRTQSAKKNFSFTSAKKLQTKRCLIDGDEIVNIATALYNRENMLWKFCVNMNNQYTLIRIKNELSDLWSKYNEKFYALFSRRNEDELSQLEQGFVQDINDHMDYWIKKFDEIIAEAQCKETDLQTKFEAKNVHICNHMFKYIGKLKKPDSVQLNQVIQSKNSIE